jgi:hypothetical protein
MTLEQEQYDDLSWAADVVSGAGELGDSHSVATHMLEHLAVSGQSAKIRQKANVLLSVNLRAAA